MEQSFVAWAKMRARRLPQVKLGIGDDAAVLASSGDDFVITTDTLMDGVHFKTAEVCGERIGRKLISVNLSDLAAMAAEPIAVFLTLCFPRNADQQLAADIYEGICQVAEKYQLAVAGGDTNCWDGPLVLGLTAVGRTIDGIHWTRSAAKPDDLIVVTGPLGGSLLGKHLDFSPRLDISRRLRGQVAIHAAMDISDGLSTDLLRICDASHCGAVLDLEKIPIADDAKTMSQSSGKTPIEHALSDGEDFELLLTVAESEYENLLATAGEANCYVVGKVTSRTGLWARENSKIRQLPATGYIHQ